MVDEHGGRFPLSHEAIVALPGIGRSTAAAILAFATGKPHAILDGNVKRVFSRHFGIAGLGESAATQAELWTLAESLVPAKNVGPYTQGLMDLGATVCTRMRPDCPRCPLRATCVALRDGRIAELPGRKAARPAPVRSVAMIVAVSRGEVLLEKRPPSGIWGGLWSLPEAPEAADPAAWVKGKFGLRVEGVERLETFTHAFTHFTLTVTPWLIRVKGSAPAAGVGDTLWLALQEAGSAALPAPVKSLLARLANQAGKPSRARGRGGAR